MNTENSFIVSPMCLETYPCQHYVTDTKTGKRTCMSGVDIYKMLNDAGLTNSHFNECC